MNVGQGPDSPGFYAKGETVVAVSLKLYMDPALTETWVMAVADLAATHPAVTSGEVGLIVLPSLPSVPMAARLLEGTAVEVGAQDLFWEDRGSYTGAVSGADLRQVGCRYVEVGHAERLSVFHEDDEVAGRKLSAALRNGLTPILCVGERREADVTTAAEECIQHLDAIFSGARSDVEISRLIVAYEPVWAIGRPEPAGSDHIIAVVAALREWLESRVRVRSLSVIYGGSAGPGLLTELAQATDGLFLGRFAHDPTALATILDESRELNSQSQDYRR